MAAKRREAMRHEYIYGNTARVMEPVKRREEYPQRPVRRRVVSYSVRRNQEMALHMNLPYVILLTLAAFCVLVICVNADPVSHDYPSFAY